MTPLSMVLPLFLMFLLTIIVGVVAFIKRVQSVKKSELTLDYFKLMSGQEVPESVVASTRNLNNQFEVPVLFYVAGILYLVLGMSSLTAVIFAWLFVFFRCVHAYIHLTYNALAHRMLSFWLALICVVVLWVMVLIYAFKM